MARAKKEKLLLEELLEQTLVKVEERPYDLPDNWIWTRLIGGFSECLDRYRKPVNARERANREGNIPYYGATGQVGWIDDFLTEEQLVLVGEDGAPFFEYIKDKAYIIEGKAWVNNHAHILKSYYGGVSNLYLMHYLNIFNYRGYVNGTTRLKLTQASMKLMPIPLPPLAEQQRIVERIESLFEKLDTAKELAQNALDSFENRKAAILHKAFTGELTAKWREENGVRLDSWEEKSLNEVCEKFQYGTSKKSQEEGKVAVLRMGNLQSGEIDWGNLVYTSDEEDIQKYLLEEGDVLFNRTNSAELVGKTSIYRGEQPAIFAGYLIRLKYKPCLDGEYLNYMLNSQKAKAYCSEVKSDGVNQSNINAKKIGEFTMPICTLEEQKEIVKIIATLLGNEQQAQELCDVIEKIDLMKKAILARAFRGELGTNNPEEESAIELLKEVLKEKL